MITASEFVMLKTTDRVLGRAVDDAQGIINNKNGQLIRLAAQLAAAQRELEIERGKRRAAEFKLMRRN